MHGTLLPPANGLASTKKHLNFWLNSALSMKNFIYLTFTFTCPKAILIASLLGIRFHYFIWKHEYIFPFSGIIIRCQVSVHLFCFTCCFTFAGSPFSLQQMSATLAFAAPVSAAGHCPFQLSSGNELFCLVKSHYSFHNCLRLQFIIREESQLWLVMLLRTWLRCPSICFKEMHII